MEMEKDVFNVANGVTGCKASSSEAEAAQAPILLSRIRKTFGPHGRGVEPTRLRSQRPRLHHLRV